MFAFVNLGIMIISSFLCTFFYVKSVHPAALEKNLGAIAYVRCKWYRILASVFELIVAVTYVGYRFVPLPIPVHMQFSWPYWVSVGIAMAISIPSLWIMFIGLKYAGKEAIAPNKDHTMYSGIYKRIRHPQALGEVFVWFVIAFLLHSPFLTLFSLIWFPIFYLFCVEEEKDLIIRYGETYIDYKRRVGMFFPKKSV